MLQLQQWLLILCMCLFTSHLQWKAGPSTRSSQSSLWVPLETRDLFKMVEGLTPTVLPPFLKNTHGGGSDYDQHGLQNWTYIITIKIVVRLFFTVIINDLKSSIFSKWHSIKQWILSRSLFSFKNKATYINQQILNSIPSLCSLWSMWNTQSWICLQIPYMPWSTIWCV